VDLCPSDQEKKISRVQLGLSLLVVRLGRDLHYRGKHLGELVETETEIWGSYIAYHRLDEDPEHYNKVEVAHMIYPFP
jgi:hypothetical protein